MGNGIYYWHFRVQRAPAYRRGRGPLLTCAGPPPNCPPFLLKTTDRQARKPKARQDRLALEASLRTFDGYVYEQLRSGRRDEILQHARERIGLWKKGKLCSAYYIQFWSGVVASGDSHAFKAMVLDAPGRRALGIMQNTPFSFLMREPH